MKVQFPGMLRTNVSDRLLYDRHHLFLLTLNDRLFLAPLEEPRRVLDVGTGNGIWAQYDHINSYKQMSPKICSQNLETLQTSSLKLR